MSETYLDGTEDNKLIELAATGDSKAVREIVERHQAMVYSTCLRILGNQADAEDAAQATFILFLKKCRKLKRCTILGGWLYSTACFVSREAIRNSTRRKRREEQAHIMNELNEQETSQVWSEMKPALDEALVALPAKHRDVVILRYLEGKTNEEAATTLGMTASAVSTCLARAIDKLRGHFHRKGIVVGTVFLSAALAKNAAGASVPASIGSAVMAASASGAAATALSASVTLLVQEALASMVWIKTKAIAMIGLLFASVSLLGFYGLQLSSEQIDALGFTEQQTTAANAIMAAHRSKYLAIEKAHTTGIREEGDFVLFEITAFPNELEKLTESFWRDFDAICDDRQKRVARRYLALENLYPYGEFPVSIQIAYESKSYSVLIKRAEKDYPEDARDWERQNSSALDPRWIRFWGDRHDATASIIESAVAPCLVAINVLPALTFENGQPVITADFVDTLNLDPAVVLQVNRILQNMHQEYLAVEKEQLGKIKVTQDPDGTKHFVVPPFHSKRKALDKKLWAELEEVVDVRQLRLIKQSEGLSSDYSALFDWGDATYTVTIRKLENDHWPEKYGIQYVREGRWWSRSNGSLAEATLPGKYRRLLGE